MWGHAARKRFGQHFLVDAAVIDAIVRVIDPRAHDMLVEIGPGLSALTQPLLHRLEHLTVIELDRDLAARLRQQHSATRLTVLQADALTVDFRTLGQSLRIVGNLPYNISSPLLFHLMDYADGVRDQVFMLQREMVERMVAAPSTAAYGRLSVMLQARYRMEKLLDVDARAFDPPPRVQSAVVRMTPLGANRLAARDSRFFAQVVARAFAQRRKMLRRSLGGWAARVAWDDVGIAATARAEDLSVAQYVALADHLMGAEPVPAPRASA